VEAQTIEVPTEGRPAQAPGSEKLLGVDGNAFAIMGTTAKLLARAGASAEFVKSYQAQAMSGSYDHLLAVSFAYLEAE
jgi:hypothetical protein